MSSVESVRVVRYACPPAPAGSPPVYTALSLAADRWVACASAGDLLLHDLALPDGVPPTLVVERGARHALVDGVLVASRPDGVCHRYERAGPAWRESARFPLAGGSPPGAGFVLSPSGRFLCVEQHDDATERGGRVVLLDAERGTGIVEHEYHLSARPSFQWLDGREVLFLSAPSYQDVLLVDCASGRSLAAFVASESFDFCHTHYALSADGTRLVTFGCVWAAPYEVRLYDATPWTRGAAPAASRFPLPLLVAQGEDLGCETVLPTSFLDADDGLLDCVSLVATAELPPEGREEAGDLASSSSEQTRDVLAAVRRLQSGAAILQRRIDPSTGAVVSWSLAGVGKTDERHVHLLSEHRVLLVHERVQRVDGRTGRVCDLGSVGAGRGFLSTSCTRGGDVVVVREAIR